MKILAFSCSIGGICILGCRPGRLEKNHVFLMENHDQLFVRVLLGRNSGRALPKYEMIDLAVLWR